LFTGATGTTRSAYDDLSIEAVERIAKLITSLTGGS
jgi:hypothetical protein